MIGEEKMKVRLTFLQDCRGTKPTDEKIYTNFIASKMLDPTEEQVRKELERLPENEEDPEYYRGVTVFPRIVIDKKKPEKNMVALDGYMLKGFFKNACWTLRLVDESMSSKISAYRKRIDNMVHVNEISPVVLDKETVEYMKTHAYTLPLCQRPLRASTMQGDRVALACSEYIQKGCTIEFEITTMGKEMMNLVIEWLDYGQFVGLGCWRNAGKGQFDWIDVDLGKKRPIDKKFIPKGKKKATDE